LGDYFAASNISLLKQKEIKSGRVSTMLVLTAAAMLGIAYSKEYQITHKTINAFDLPTYKMTPHFEEAFQFIDEGLKRGNVLVHCAAGISRVTQ
jgi:protein-tyrosine phosphatase